MAFNGQTFGGGVSMDSYLTQTDFFDYQHPALHEFSAQHVTPKMSKRETAVALYYAVRDAIQYNPYVFDPAANTFSASHCLLAGQSYCIPKAILLGALCRLNGIPARLGLADVKNHLSSPQLIEYLQSDIFVMHGYIELCIDGNWVKATPAFNKALCERMGVAPLEFNGREDSIFHEFNGAGQQAMEYLTEYGSFTDVPHGFIVSQVAMAYPHLAKDFMANAQHGCLQQDLDE